MYIKPIGFFSSTDIVAANRFRRVEIKNVMDNKKLIDNLFLELKVSLDYADIHKIEEILSYKLFFEIIPAECITALSSKYLELNEADKANFMQLLKDSYINKGDRGFIFSFIPIINTI